MRFHRILIQAILLIVAFLAAGRAQGDEGNACEDAAVLPIPDRDQTPSRPPEGWCGEDAIQQAALFFGAYFPQKMINEAGSPPTPDLRNDDVPAALERLQMDYSCRPETPEADIALYREWVTNQILYGHPVIIGVQTYPTDHPEWNIDHFMLAVGFTRNSLLYNTTGGFREERSFDLLNSRENGFSFNNNLNTHYACAVDGFRDSENLSSRTTIHVLREDERRMHIRVKNSKLVAGKGYVLLMFNRLSGVRGGRPNPADAVWMKHYVASGPQRDFEFVIRKDDPAIFRNLPDSSLIRVRNSN